MQSTLDVLYVRSVDSTFSWDNANYSYNKNIKPSAYLNGLPVYVCTAPLAYVFLSSAPILHTYNETSSYYIRKVNFGDYYNQQTNVVAASGLDPIFFTHTYIMPGRYQVSLDQVEYTTISPIISWIDSTVETTDNISGFVWTDYTNISATALNGKNVLVPQVTALVTPTQTTSFILSVVEIPPTAYLSSNIPTSKSDIVFPLTVTITPKYTQTGSFPIEKIVWDMGDGSPQITKTRWDGNTTTQFVSTGALSADLLDPRNFDITHTYIQPNNSVYSFYPSITAYASSTGTGDSCSITIGPITPQTLTDEINLLQTDFNENGIVVVGQVGSDIAIWKTQ